MAISGRVKAFLDASKAAYSAMKHPVVYTAQEIAAAQHVPGRQLAKCVLVNTNRGPILSVLPAVHLIDLKKLKAVAGATSLSIAKETDIKARFPDVEVGAMSPFGNLYHVPVVVDRALGESEEIVFNAGSHTDTITMRYQDFARLVAPSVGAFGQPIGGPTPAKRQKAAPPAARGKRGKPRSATRARVKNTKRSSKKRR